MSTDSAAGRLATASACEPYRELITEGLERGRNARAIWQDLVDDHRSRARYASVLRFVRRLRGTQVPEARVLIRTAPGEECQVDYDRTGRIESGAGYAQRPPLRLDISLHEKVALNVRDAMARRWTNSLWSSRNRGCWKVP